ncbi:hypothetical protein [Nocardia sp. CC227C]|uniref:hypothetical protein n=1 Tax=Nocardia sp. CC227C TaxID=3044562 RepID=UPI00278C41F3|nr:hypothetical protein [Nocardia sp. CC227C]
MSGFVTFEQLHDWIGHAKYPDLDDARAMADELLRLRELIEEFTDSGDCWFDHNGNCQAHGFFGLEPGELCPHAEAKQLLAEWKEGER